MSETVSAAEPMLEVSELTVDFPTDDGLLHAVNHVTFGIARGETVGIVGESGSGKSVMSMAIMGLLPKSARVTGSVKFRGQELLGASERDFERIRGSEIAMVFQDALASLNPVHTVGAQVAEAVAIHQELKGSELRNAAIELLDVVGIANPSARFEQYPHEFSGGMRQRAMIAMAIANDPAVLIADEPTTALDVTIQAQVLEVLERIQERTSTSIMLITHDLGVVAGVADSVMVMYAGSQVERGSVEDIFYESRHPYTKGLLASLPRMDRRMNKSDRLHQIEGQPPSLVFLPTGCAFHPRCAFAETPGACDGEVPALRVVGDGHYSACHFADRIGSEEGAMS